MREKFFIPADSRVENVSGKLAGAFRRAFSMNLLHPAPENPPKSQTTNNNVLHRPIQISRNVHGQIPTAPLDTTWDPAARTLSTSALPPAATRLEAWRVGPGSMPELLVTGSPGITSLSIPATITFTPGGLYHHHKPGPMEYRHRTRQSCICRQADGV